MTRSPTRPCNLRDYRCKCVFAVSCFEFRYLSYEFLDNQYYGLHHHPQKYSRHTSTRQYHFQRQDCFHRKHHLQRDRPLQV